jgi:hypothetical protein
MSVDQQAAVLLLIYAVVKLTMSRDRVGTIEGAVMLSLILVYTPVLICSISVMT